MELGGRVTLTGFVRAAADDALRVPAEVRDRLHAARAIVDEAAAGDAPVYGLNTGLGANLGHRIAPDAIAAFQHQLLAGRAVAVGPPLPEDTGRQLLLARLIGAARGHSGLSLEVFEHLCAVFRSGMSPVVPQHGSIGASDLTQNAVWALALLGQGQMWRDGCIVSAQEALTQAGLTPPVLQPKDAMALINHGALSVALSGQALRAAREAVEIGRHVALLSVEGFGANPGIFAPQINGLRSSPGQAEMAAWFWERLPAHSQTGRVQDALSFRTLAPVMGAAMDAAQRAVAIWEAELNGASDNPAVLGTAAMCSTPNFHAPALALALEQVSLAQAMLGQGMVMRMQRMMDPDLSGLPRYLTPVGGASAGFVPLQKTAAALLAEVRRQALPVVFDPAPVSDGVEDMAPMTAQAAQKLSAQTDTLCLLMGCEALVAAQARDLRGLARSPLHRALRERVDFLQEDRALGDDVSDAVAVLRDFVTLGNNS